MTATVSPHPMVGAVLSARYRLTSVLGEGGMGTVFEAQDLQGHSRYAIKVLHPEYANNEQVVSRFYTEAQAASRLQHPNIARCFAFALAEDRSPYLILELLDGSSLASYLKPGVAYGAEHAVPMMRGVLAALDEAHRQGLVHRDIKPDNIFLVRNPNGPPLVKVLDFGIAKMMDAAGGMMSKTRTGMLLGTPAYMSPEQIRDAKAVDFRADLWSAAVIFYELLTGRDAFPAPTEMAKLTAILSAEPVPVDQGRPHLTGWRGFFEKALAKDPALRFTSAIEMERAMSATDRAARVAIGPSAPPSTTDMSPELPKGISAHSAPPPQVLVIAPAPPPTPAGSDSTLKAGDLPVLVARGVRVPLWVMVFVATLTLLLGVFGGFILARP